MNNALVAFPQLTYSQGREISDNYPSQHTAATWDEFARVFDAPNSMRSTAKGGRYICGAMRHGQPAGKPAAATWRCNELAAPVAWIAFDFDNLDGPAALDALIATCRAMFRCLWYHTASSTAQRPRVRIVAPLDREASPAEIAALAATIAPVLGVARDTNQDRTSQPLYLPLRDAIVMRCDDAPPINASMWLAQSPPASAQVQAVAQEWTSEPCCEWRGPTDDDELLRRMLATAPSAAAAFGSRATFAQLWNADAEALARSYPAAGRSDGMAYDASSADAALAAHLAFWTGKDAARMERLMERSALARDKWKRTDYLERTIMGAIARQAGAYQERQPTTPQPPTAAPSIIAEAIKPEEWLTARPAPDCIVQDYLFADVAVFIAPGGTGKTTLKLFEAAHIALGLPLYSLIVRRPGAVLIVTAEDSREMLVARLREICREMALTAEQVAIVRQRVHIADVAGAGFRLTEISGDTVRPHRDIGQFVDACRAINPALIIVDPAVSFGVGESRVNDAEQGLIEAARTLRKALNCCIQYIHHSGKQNARDKALDQYAGRGGSAFADGARMVHVLQSVPPAEWLNETGAELAEGETGLRIARPKMSYCAPQGDIFIRRKGHRFEHVARAISSKADIVERNADTVLQLMHVELAAGRFHSARSLEQLDHGLARAALRAAVDYLLAARRIESRPVPASGKGGKQNYLHPIADPIRHTNGAPINFPEKTTVACAAEESQLLVRRPIGKSDAAHLAAASNPVFPRCAGNDRRTNGAPSAPIEQSSEI